jgi:putative proteasome-type protease
MTYGLAMRMNDGLVFLSDTRTNAGVDNVSTYRKLHVFRPAPDRLFVLQSAGNLATTQEVLDRLTIDLEISGDHESLASVAHLFEAALYVGRLSQRVTTEHRDALQHVSVDGTATFILGGQIANAPPDILLVYPEGNYIRASDERPFLQIGETKYGKFLLDFVGTRDVDLVTATKIGLGSMMSTARANLSVGPPYDAAVYRTGSYDLDEYRFTTDSVILKELSDVWERHLVSLVNELPHVALSELRDAEQREP